MDPVVIRPASPHDDGALAAFFAAYHKEFRHELGDQDVTGEGRKARQFYAKGAMLVADDGTGPVGCVAFEPWGPQRARMKRMFVPEAHRGRGIGRQLASAVLEAARAKGYTTMVLDTSAPMAAATALYRDLGFTEFDPDYVAPCNDTLYLSRPL